MKTKTSFIIGIVAIITLSFTFANSNDELDQVVENKINSSDAPVGGFVADEIVK